MSANPSIWTILPHWSLHPIALIGVILTGAVYWRGLRLLTRRGDQQNSIWHVTSFAVGLAMLVVALDSPLDFLSDYLMSAHIGQFFLLLMIVPVLLLLGRPVEALLEGTPPALVQRVAQVSAERAWVRGLAERATAPAEAWLLYAGNMFVWFFPSLYQATFQHQSLMDLEYLCFFVTGLLFWWVTIEPLGGPARLNYGMRIAYTWSMTFPVTALGVVLTIINPQTPLYTMYTKVPQLWGSSPISDQQFGGVTIWLGGSAVYIVAASVLFFAMMSDDERRQLTLVLPEDEHEET